MREIFYGKKGQVTIFIIIALVLVASVGVYFAVKERIFFPEVPAEFKPVYDFYLECIRQETQNAMDLAGSQGGRVYVPDYIPGSEYAPFSSQLNFLGFPIPYWYYVSGNGLIKEQVPTKADMEKDIARFIEERHNLCNFDKFYAQGFSINFGTPRVNVKVEDTKILVDVSAALAVSREDQSALKTEHKIELNSKLGKFHRLAMEIYGKQKTEAFLEDYSIDVMRLYAPVDGVDLSCSGSIWKTREVSDTIKSGLESNIGAIRFKGDYYTLRDKRDEYFVVDKEVDESVSLIYSRSWPTKIEIVGEGVDRELMVAKPIGNQEGLGLMGFCYSPYHFVYDISFPVLVQIFDEQDVFQFPVVVVIDKNVPRKAIFSEITPEEEFDLCEFNTQDVQVSIFDITLKPVDANISYNCFTQQCSLGESKNGVFAGKAPACVNGYLYLRAGGYAEKRQLFSTNTEVFADVILDKEYEVELALDVGARPFAGTAIVSFAGERSVSTVLPESSKIKISEGFYNVTVFAYSNASITLPASSKTQCTEVPRGGIFGFFGGSREECIDISIPETKIESALVGGGRGEIYILPSDLEKGKITLKVDAFPIPTSLEQLQLNFEAFEGSGVGLD